MHMLESTIFVLGFNYTQIIKTLNALPDSMSNFQYTNFCNSGYGLKM